MDIWSIAYYTGKKNSLIWVLLDLKSLLKINATSPKTPNQHQCWFLRKKKKPKTTKLANSPPPPLNIRVNINIKMLWSYFYLFVCMFWLVLFCFLFSFFCKKWYFFFYLTILQALNINGNILIFSWKFINLLANYYAALNSSLKIFPLVSIFFLNPFLDNFLKSISIFLFIQHLKSINITWKYEYFIKTYLTIYFWSFPLSSLLKQNEGEISDIRRQEILLYFNIFQLFCFWPTWIIEVGTISLCSTFHIFLPFILKRWSAFVILNTTFT